MVGDYTSSNHQRVRGDCFTWRRLAKNSMAPIEAPIRRKMRRRRLLF